MSDDKERMIVNCCPHCGSTQTHTRSGHWADRRVKSTIKRWWCTACKSEFNTPNRRKAQNTGHQRKGLARKLIEADPDEVTR